MSQKHSQSKPRPAEGDDALSTEKHLEFGHNNHWFKRLTVILVLAISLVLFIQFFNAISTVLLGVLAAAIVSCTLSPLLKYVPGPRAVAAGVLGLSLIAGAATIVLALSWPLAKPINNAFANWTSSEAAVNRYLSEKNTKFGFVPKDIHELTITLDRILVGGQTGGQFFGKLSDVVLSILLWMVFIFIGSIFLLTESADVLIGPASLVAPPNHRREFQLLVLGLGPKLRRWVLGTMLSMTIVFTASLIGYSLIGLKLAVPLALLAAVCEIVPTVGPAVAAVIAGIFAAATMNSNAVAGVATVYGIIQAVEAYVILPMIMRGAVKIHPAVTLFSVVLWGKIFGVPGLILAIPINLVLWEFARTFLISTSPHDIMPSTQLPIRGQHN